MPFAIWCTTCPKPTIIGQGVRFNAEKKKVENYLSSPIFSFRMKHVACGGVIEIGTDPKNTAYVVTEGAKKRDTGDDKYEDGDIVIRTEEEKERLRNDAFAALEVTIDDKKQAKQDKSRIEELQEAKEKDWDDPYAASKRLRHAFRADRKIREKDQKDTLSIQDKLSFGFDLLAETEEDRRRARLIDYGNTSQEFSVSKINSRALFPDNVPANASSRHKAKSEKLPTGEKTRLQLQKDIRDNTRAAIDPFLRSDKSVFSAVKPIRGIRRKRSPVRNEPDKSRSDSLPCVTNGGTTATSLVDYESD